jgi:uncharacterized protein (TIGR02598 family)
MDQKRTFHRLSAAFTLVEVAVAMLVIGILFVALYSLIAMNLSVARVSSENQVATQILTEKLETIRLYTWDQICSNGVVPTNFWVAINPSKTNTGAYYTGRVSIVEAPIIEPYKSDLREVTVSVDWTSGQRFQTRSMNSYVAKYGMQSYIVR